MARFDLGSVLGAVLGGGSAPRGVRRGTRSRGGQQNLGRALAMLAGVAIEAMSKAQQPSTPPPPSPAPRGRTRGALGAPAGKPAPVPGGPKSTPRSRGSVPASENPDPWGQAPSGKPAPLPGGTRATPRSRGSVPASGVPGPWGQAPSGKPAPSEGWAPMPGLPQAPPVIAAEDREGVLMLRAMIAAARADGEVDAEERARIAEQLDAAGLGPAARDAVLSDFDRAVPPETLARDARDPMLAAQVYAAAVAGAGRVEGAERTWLDTFARALRLDRAAAEAIERRLLGG